MAEAIIGATVEILLEKVISLISGKIDLALGFNKDLQDLGEHARGIQAVLADAETKEYTGVVKNWFRKVEEAALEAYYVLDELHYESIRREVKSRNQKKVCMFFSMSKHDVSFRLRMSSKVRDINYKLKTFNDKAVEIGLLRMAHSPLPCPVSSTAPLVVSRQTDSLPVQFFAGRDEDVSHVVEMLLGFCDQNISVLPIVGMGGLGKTTLAKTIYNHPQISTHFNKKGWVCVSDKFEVIEVFRGILESLKQGKGEKVDMSSRDAIAHQLRIEVNRGRFLFVLDDVWNVMPNLWDDFLNSLAALEGANGSCCLLTTRLHKTANTVSPHNPFTLKKLPDDDCWSILTQRATGGGEFPDELKVHKNQILSKCKGVPLAAKVIGGLLSLHRTQDWLSIVEDKVLKISEDVRGEITPILRLSFDHLPSPSIKKCFAYLSIYAKDSMIHKDKLIQFWAAEGFLREDVERATTMEEIGSNYLGIFLQSSLLEIYDHNYYQMHDLIHDLAENVAGREEFGGENTNTHVRHLTSYEGKSYRADCNAKSSLVRMMKDDISNDVLLKFKNLHILHLSDDKLKSLIPSLSKLKHLRYLSLSCGGSYRQIKTLPQSLCTLFHLQTLRLDGWYLKSFPPGFSNLVNLRHLELDLGNGEFQMPYEMRQLTCLQTLKFFYVGAQKGHGIEELGYLRNLNGSLEIRNLEVVKDGEEARSANLFEKKNLMQLELRWDHVRDSIDNCDEQVLEGLKPHSNLKVLSIYNFMGVRFPQWLGILSALFHLELDNCKSCTELPTLGHLAYLEVIKIRDLENVVCIGDSFYNFDHSKLGKAFPALKTLMFSQMTNLTEWKEFRGENGDGGEAFSKLEWLSILGCCHLASTPIHFPSLVSFRVRGVNVRLAEAIIDESGSLLKWVTLDDIGGFDSLSNVIKRPLTSLEGFSVSNCNALIDIQSSQFEDCTSLQELHVIGCPNLKYFPLHLQQTPSLSYITLTKCPNLFTVDAIMPRGFNHLTQLRQLSIGLIPDAAMNLFDWPGLSSSSLADLNLYGSPDAHLPPQLQHCTSLTSLRLYNFESVSALPDWLGKLTSLEELAVRNCPKLLQLPSAQAMGHLTKLRRFHSAYCALISKSWARKNEPHSEWAKLSHLPNLQVTVFPMYRFPS